MSLIRRYSAASLAAFALLLGACGGEPAPTGPTPGVGEIGDNPLRISIDPGAMMFHSTSVVAPAPQTLATSGLVAIGSAVEFGTTSYTLGAPGWLRISPTPVFQREPLAWLHQVWVDQAAYASLPDGVYLATVPVIVRAAQNSPRVLAVTLCKGVAENCLPPDGVVSSSMDTGDGTWARGANLAAPGGHRFEDYILTVPAMTTVSMIMEGSTCGAPVTLFDPYLYVFTMGGVLVDLDDDGECGFNSYLEVENNTGAPVSYRVRATTFGSGALGTYNLYTSTTGFVTLRAPAEETPEFAELLARKAANPEK